MSTAPPGALGTTIVTGLPGKPAPCATAGTGAASAAARVVDASRKVRRIMQVSREDSQIMIFASTNINTSYHNLLENPR